MMHQKNATRTRRAWLSSGVQTEALGKSMAWETRGFSCSQITIVSLASVVPGRRAPWRRGCGTVLVHRGGVAVAPWPCTGEAWLRHRGCGTGAPWCGTVAVHWGGVAVAPGRRGCGTVAVVPWLGTGAAWLWHRDCDTGAAWLHSLRV